MKLQRILVREFGTLERPVEIELRDGLNIVHGENESGKTTLLRAVWTALTWDPTTSSKEVTRWNPYGGGTPHVEVDFCHAGTDYELAKTFESGRGTAELTCRSEKEGVEKLAGDAVEARLRETLGFGHSENRRVSYPDHYGLWPLLWVWQWESAREPAGDEHFESPGRGQIAEHLSRETGEVLESERAHATIEAAAAEFERYWTSKGRPTQRSDAAIRSAKDDLAEARERHSELKEREQSYNEYVDRYEALGEQIDQTERELPEKERRAEEAADQVAEIEERTRDLEKAERMRDAAENELELVGDRTERRAELRSEIDAIEAEIDTIDEELAETRDKRDGLDDELPSLEERCDQLTDKREVARNRVAALEAARDLIDNDSRVEQLEADLEQVESRLETVRELERERASIAVDREAVSELESKRETWREAETRLRSASARVRIEARDKIDVEFDGDTATLQEGEQRDHQLDRPTTFTFPGIVTVRVEPGGTELTSLREDVDEKRQALAESLSEYGVGSVDEARERLEERRSLGQQIENERNLIDQVAPEGADALREQLTERRAELAQRRQVFEERAPEELELPEDDDVARERLKEARARCREVESELEEAKSDLRSVQERRKEVTSKIDSLSQRRDDREAQLEKLRESLDTHVEKHGPDDQLEREREEAEQKLDNQRGRVEKLRKALDEFDLEDARRRRDRLETVVEQLDSDLEEFRQERRDVRVRIESSELEGLHDRIASAEADVRDAEDELERLRKKANAAKLLYRSLQRARSELRSTFLQPLRRRTSELLERVLPEATVRFDEDFTIEAVTRPSTSSEPYDVLSGGTSEQVGVVVRIALAELVNEQARFPLVLDEPFVATDPDRFEALIPILRRAAQSLQIVVATHDWQRYRELGLPGDHTHDLERLKLADRI